jgi:hypothetical protein
VDSIWLLPVPRGRDRLCAVQVWFAGGERPRDYVIFNRPANSGGRRGGSTSGSWRAKALVEALTGERDLRKRQDAQRVEKALAGADLDALWEALTTDLARRSSE